ncbi:MAG: hypothetical protein E7774_07155 [Bradyrhizobium sp.]|nr:MAG: hypothetical protein E7774_07155 [Bradyrhizobium sp.]
MSKAMPTKRSELANILRRLADYVDNHPDEDLAPIFRQAATLMRSSDQQKKPPPSKMSPVDVRAIAGELQTLQSRDAGETLLREKVPSRSLLEAIARFLQLPVQRDDAMDKLRTKIVENTIGSRLRSNAIQGKSK